MKNILVEKELIEQAKHKLGDKNAFLMAELLGLEKFDEKNLKACCPYHKEDTPSFIYDKKKMRWHCFGCNKTVDIVDVLTNDVGMTFLDATKWLFEKAGIEYAFGEQNVKTRNKYKYPKPESEDNDKSKVYKYLASRGISKETVDRLDIRANKDGDISFNTYDDNDTICVVNYRVSYKKKNGEGKCWFQKNADSADLLWNMQNCNISKPLVITEGQIDCASVVEAGYSNAVSVLKGSGNLHWIEECFEFLEQFDSIIIASDNDTPGIKMRNECINRLGAWRCKYIEIPKELEFKDTGRIVPISDLNEVLQSKGSQFLLDLIDNARDIPITSVARLSDIKELNPYEMDGFQTGIKPLDDEIMKIFTGGVTLLTGLPSSGKTTFLNQIALMAMDNEFPVFLFSRELLNGMSTSWLNNVASGLRGMKEITLGNGDKFSVVRDEVKSKIMKYYNDSLFIYKDEEDNGEDALLRSMEECTRKKGAKLFLIDNLMTVTLNEDEEGSNKAQKNFMTRLIKFSMKYNVAVVLVAHPRKLAAGQELGMFDVAGSSTIVNLATRTIGLKRVTDSQKEDMKYKYHEYSVIIQIIKDRIFGSTKDIPVHYEKKSRRFYTSYEEYDRVYKWDTNVYHDKLPYDTSNNIDQLPE